MSIEEFIRKNQEELVENIRQSYPELDYNETEEIELWVWNDEGLYNWAMSEGVEDE